MKRSLLEELELDALLELVAANARTRAGRQLITETHALPAVGEGFFAGRLTLEVERLHAEIGPVSLAGIDEAVPLLAAGAPAATEVDQLLALLTLARRLAGARRALAAAPGELELLHDLGARLPETDGLVQWAARRLGRDGQIPDDATPELARLRRRLISARQEVIQRLEAVRRAHADAVADAPVTVRRDRYCLPVRAGARSRLPGLVLDSSGSGATVYLEPYEAVELNNVLVDTGAREREEVRRIVDEVAAAFAAARDDLRQGAELLARLDAAQAKALFGRTAGGRVVQPAGDRLVLRGARHPLLDPALAELRAQALGPERARRGERPVVPLDFELRPGVRTLVVSGPNAGGKTVVLKTIGLMVLMAFYGIPLPAGDGTAIPEFDGLWCHIGDEQDVSADLSTFSAAMAGTAALLAHPGRRVLVLFDELGAGTDPLEGSALATALLEEVSGRPWLTVATTHLAAVALQASASAAMENAAMEYDEAAGRPTYRLSIGRPGRSHGLEIAATMGVPAAVVERARALLGDEHLRLEHWLDRLEAAEAELRSERGRLGQERDRLERERRAATAELERLEAERRGLDEELVRERDRLRRLARERLDAALAQLDEAQHEQREVSRRQRERLRAAAADLPRPEGEAAPAGAGLEPGATVRVRSLGSTGELLEQRGSRSLVVVGGKRLWVEDGDLEATAAPSRRRRAEVRVEVEEAPPSELNLLGQDAEAAREELERFLDRALATGRGRVRVVHGHGTGTLRRMVAEVCRHHPAVRAFRHPPPNLGGTGATEVELEVAGG